MEEEVVYLRSLVENLKMAMYVDSLTGLYNRVGLYDALYREWDRCKRDKTPISVIFIDVNQFKAVNKHYGHNVADEKLAEIGSILNSIVKRPADIASRPMGDEFVVVLPSTSLDGAEIVSSKIENEISKAKITNKSSEDGILTVTCGVASSEERPGYQDADEMLSAASRFMMRKKAGFVQGTKTSPQQIPLELHFHDE